MTKYKYSVKNLKENQAKALARDASVSFKSAIEACNFLRGRTTKQALSLLEKVLDKKIAIPFKRFTNGVGHRRGNGIAAGRYPQKLSDVLIKLIKNAEANASIKGLNENLKIVHFSAQKASVPMHYGRHPRREMKRSHIELIVEEVEEKKKEHKKKKSDVKKEVKKEAKKEKVEKEITKEVKPKVENKKNEIKEEPKEIMLNNQKIIGTNKLEKEPKEEKKKEENTQDIKKESDNKEMLNNKVIGTTGVEDKK